MLTKKKKYNLPKGFSLLETTLKTPQFLKHPINFITGNMKKLNGTYSISLGGSNIIMTQDPDFISYVLKDNQRNYKKAGFAVERAVKYVGNGLVFSDGEYWRRQRRLIQPSFHRQKIKDLGANVLKTIQNNLADFPESQQVDINPIVHEFALKILIKSLFDVEIAPEIMTRFSKIFPAVQDFLINDINNPLSRFLYPINGKERKVVAKIEEVRRIFLDLIQERKASKGQFADLLDMLLNSRYEDNGESMTEEQIIDELMIFISAGHETTANTLSWILYLLAANPESQEKLFELANEQSVESLAMNVYMQAIIQEGMRLYTTTWSTQRVAIEDDTFGAYTYPKGTVVVPFFFGLHRTDQLWENALQFQPERFIADGKLAKHKHFFPFGAGPRMCIGNHFALMEMAYFIGEFVKAFKIKTTGQVPDTEALLTMRPDKVILEIRKR